MRHHPYIVFVLAIVAACAAQAAEHDAAPYNRANALYRAGRYGQAVEEYENVLRQGVQNADVYYNLGNACYKAGRLGMAILNYERALRLSPNDPDIIANLRFVDAVKRDQMEAEETNVVNRALRRAYLWVSPNGLALLGSVCLFALAGAGIGWLFLPARRSVWAAVLAVALLTGAVSAGLLGLKIHDSEGVRRAVVVSTEAHARSGPGDEYLKVFTVHEGTRVTVERKEAGWILVRLQNGVGGWLAGAGIEEI